MGEDTDVDEDYEDAPKTVSTHLYVFCDLTPNRTHFR